MKKQWTTMMEILEMTEPITKEIFNKLNIKKVDTNLLGATDKNIDYQMETYNA